MTSSLKAQRPNRILPLSVPATGALYRMNVEALHNHDMRSRMKALIASQLNDDKLAALTAQLPHLNDAEVTSLTGNLGRIWTSGEFHAMAVEGPHANGFMSQHYPKLASVLRRHADRAGTLPRDTAGNFLITSLGVLGTDDERLAHTQAELFNSHCATLTAVIRRIARGAGDARRTTLELRQGASNTRAFASDFARVDAAGATPVDFRHMFVPVAMDGLQLPPPDVLTLANFQEMVDAIGLCRRTQAGLSGLRSALQDLMNAPPFTRRRATQRRRQASQEECELSALLMAVADLVQAMLVLSIRILPASATPRAATALSLYDPTMEMAAILAWIEQHLGPLFP